MAEKEVTAQASELPKEAIMLKYTFTEEEILALGQDSARTTREIHNKKTELDSIKKEYAGEIKAMEAEVDLLSQHINNGFKMDRVTCVKKQVGRFMHYWTQDQNPDVDDPVAKKPMTSGHQYTAL